jgi:hypothetical protein
MLKVIFLDVDGVLATSESIGKGKLSREPRDSSFYHAALIDPACAKRVLRIEDATGAKIVLASAWRKFSFQLAGLHRAFMSAGLTGREVREMFIGSTPEFQEDRSVEITAWLRAHPEVTSYVVIDDSIVPGHPQAQPRPDFFAGGLLDATADDAIRILNGGTQ